MSESLAIQRIAESLIRVSCRRLPEELRAERCREWSAELPAILHDETARLGIVRSVRALNFSAGIATSTRRLNRMAGRSRRSSAAAGADGAAGGPPVNLAIRGTIGVVSWFVIVSGTLLLLRAFPHQHRWAIVLGLMLAAGFAACCIADIARAAAVRYLPKWAWALICVAQIPSGGIAYLSVGRIRRAGSLPPA